MYMHTIKMLIFQYKSVRSGHPITSQPITSNLRRVFTNKCQTTPPLIRLHVYHLHNFMKMYYNCYYGKYRNIFMVGSYVSYYISEHVWNKAQVVII